MRILRWMGPNGWGTVGRPCTDVRTRARMAVQRGRVRW